MMRTGIGRELRVYADAVARRRHQPDVRFVVFAQGRSGSTLLGELLGAHPDVHWDGEILATRVRAPGLWVEGCSRRSRAPVYGYKVKIYQPPLARPTLCGRMETTPSRLEHWLVRLLAIAALVSLPAFLAVERRYSEPYPALTQPAFAGAPAAAGIARTLSPELEVAFDDGTGERISVDDFLDGIPVLKTAVLRHAFGHARSRHLRDPEVLEWAQGRAVEATGRGDVDGITIRWVRREIELSTGRVVRSETERVVLVPAPS